MARGVCQRRPRLRAIFPVWALAGVAPTVNADDATLLAHEPPANSSGPQRVVQAGGLLGWRQWWCGSGGGDCAGSCLRETESSLPGTQFATNSQRPVQWANHWGCWRVLEGATETIAVELSEMGQLVVISAATPLTNNGPAVCVLCACGSTLAPRQPEPSSLIQHC